MPDAEQPAQDPEPTGRASSPERRGFNPRRFARNAVIITAAIVLAVWYGAKGVWPHVVPKNFGTVVEGELYRSGELTPTATRTVAREHGLRTIIDLGAHEPGSREERIAQSTAESLGLTRHRFSLFGDATGDWRQYAEALAIATDPANQPVLIHCAAGAQRTGCAIALYRHLVEGRPLDEAYTEAANYRHDPQDNPKLEPYLRTHAPEVAAELGRLRAAAGAEPVAEPGPKTAEPGPHAPPEPGAGAVGPGGPARPMEAPATAGTDQSGRQPDS